MTEDIVGRATDGRPRTAAIRYVRMTAKTHERLAALRFPGQTYEGLIIMLIRNWRERPGGARHA